MGHRGWEGNGFLCGEKAAPWRAAFLFSSLIGILSKLSGILAENKIGIFAVSTFNTDYILVKAENFEKAMSILSEEGYTVI
ncbi:ACT domain-containing protein [uncultured Dialister sp.]|uniref:ACT domain-containing protein n=1 Tax=uncultured Dialister sp. TaxID=278064 RepID=UPI00344B68D6